MVEQSIVSPQDIIDARAYSMVLEWSPADDVWIVSVTALPGLHTHGETRAEAIEMGEEVIALWIAGLRKHGQPVPEPRRFAAASSA